MKKFFSKVFDKTQKMSPLFVCLVVLSTSTMLITSVMACKTFPLFGWNVAGYALSMPVSFITFPITYILSDLFSEVYGYKWSRITCYISFTMTLLMVCCFQLGILFPGSDEATSTAFKSILGATPLTLVAELVAFVVGDLANDLVFKRMKKRADAKGNKSTGSFMFRAIVSSVAGEVIDSGIFIPILYLNLLISFKVPYPPFYAILVIILVNASIKLLFELIVSPLTALISKKVGKYELAFRKTVENENSI